MKKSKIIIFIIGLILLIIPFMLNFYSIYKLLAIGLGIILLDVCFVLNKKTNIFLIIYLPILLIIITYSIDYIKTYTLKLSPIYVLENKINNNVSIYNSVLYRVYKCENNYIFDNNYKKDFPCDTKLIENIDINKLLNEPQKNYNEYKNNFIKVSGKISKINGNSTLELQEYKKSDNSINGYVEFNNSSKLIVDISNNIINKYKVYDYITIVGLVKSYNNNEITLVNTKIEDNDLYNNYKIEVIEKSKCDEDYSLYMNNYYSKCINNIYIDYGIDIYELSYAIDDGKIKIDELINKGTYESYNKNKLYKYDKFKLLACQNDKNYLLSNNEKIDLSLCEN